MDGYNIIFFYKNHANKILEKLIRPKRKIYKLITTIISNRVVKYIMKWVELMDRENILHLEKRKQIYNEIKIHPGLHLMELKRRMNIPKTTLKYHLNFLEKQNLIIRKKDRRYSRYFITLKVGTEEKKIFNMLRQPVPRNIIFVIFCYVACSEIDIVREIKKNQSTVSFHLKKLIEDGIIEIVPHEKGRIKRTDMKGYIIRSPYPNEKFFKLKEAELIQSMLIKYQESLLVDSISDSILFWSLLFDRYDKKPKNFKKYGHELDVFLKAMYDIFPPPYPP